MPRKAAGKKFRQQNIKRERNWTEKETELICEILSDPVERFAFTLELRALKKQANKEVFEEIQNQVRVALLDPDFIKENQAYADDVDGKPLDISIPKLRNKYNNLKKAWRVTVDRAKNGSGLHVEREPMWFQILHPVLTDTKSVPDH